MRTVIWWIKLCKNGKVSQIFCFKILKDRNLLCEALVQNCSDLSHIFADSRINRFVSNITISIEVCHAECKNNVSFIPR